MPEEPIPFTPRGVHAVDVRILRIVEHLYDDAHQGRQGQLLWRATDDRDAYAAEHDGYTFTVVYVYDTFSRETYRLEIARDGKPVESASDLCLTRECVRKMRRVFEHARAQVLGLSEEDDGDVFVELNLPE